MGRFSSEAGAGPGIFIAWVSDRRESSISSAFSLAGGVVIVEHLAVRSGVKHGSGGAVFAVCLLVVGIGFVSRHGYWIN